MSHRAFSNTAVESAFLEFPAKERSLLLDLRELILETSDETDGVGLIEETLKWGEPAYLTMKPKSGTTIRLGISKTGVPALFTHCQTTVVAAFQALFPDDFTYDGNRAVYVNELSAETRDKLRLLITHALTYHRKQTVQR